jgi:hypothetical protein
LREFEKLLILLKEMVLPDRIELSTSPLPMAQAIAASANAIRKRKLKRNYE